MTIYDISKKAGVSIATVSRVLNGSDKVRPSTKKKVMDIIEKYDYTPNAFARGMGLTPCRRLVFSVQIPRIFFSQRQFIIWNRSCRQTVMSHCSAVPDIIWSSSKIT